MKKLLSQIIAAGFGLWIASIFVPGVVIKLNSASSFFGVALTSDWQLFFILGIALGLINFFVKPILKLLALPLEIITLGLFSIVISMGMIWFIDAVFTEVYIPLIMPLLLTTVIIWLSNKLIEKIFIRDED